MKTHQHHRPALLGAFVAMLLAIPALALAAQSFPRVGITPLLNTSDDATSDTLATEISQTIGSTLISLAGMTLSSCPTLFALPVRRNWTPLPPATGTRT
jgi:hypothetical protein